MWCPNFPEKLSVHCLEQNVFSLLFIIITKEAIDSSSTYLWLNSSTEHQPYLQSLEILVQYLLIEQRELYRAKFRAVTLVAGKIWVDQIFCWSLQTFCSCSLPPLPVIQTVIKYLVNLLWINVNQIECEYSRTVNKFKGKQQRYPLLDHHGLLNLLSAATSLQVLPTGLILPPEHLDSNHHRYKSFKLRVRKAET